MVSGMQESDPDSRDRLTAGRERLPKAALFDLDGALADISLLAVMHPGDPRLKELESRPDHHRVVPAHDWVVELAAEQRRAGIAVIVLTSRRERWRERSKEWLVMQRVPFDALIMRADTDDRPEVEFKRAALVDPAAVRGSARSRRQPDRDQIVERPRDTYPARSRMERAAHVVAGSPLSRAGDQRATHYEGVVWVTAGDGCRCEPRPGSRLVMARMARSGSAGTPWGHGIPSLGNASYDGRCAWSVRRE